MMTETHRLIGELRSLTSDHCPTCASPQPRLHPRNTAGVVAVCGDVWHGIFGRRTHATIAEVMHAAAPTFTPTAELETVAAAAELAPPQAAPAAADTTPEEPHMSLITDAQTIAAKIGDDLSTVVSHLGQLAGNPLVDAIAEAGLGLVLSPAEVQTVLGVVQAIEAGRKQQDTGQPAADPTATPAVTNQG